MILVIDNYDSFTYNLVQLLAGSGAGSGSGPAAEIRVLRNDAASADGMLALGAQGIVISPGPGRPESAGVCVELLRRREPVPILGVCLGHQAMAVAFGAEVDRAPYLMHGKTSPVRHLGRGPFAGLPDPFEATRYHSLAVREETLPAELEPIAWSEDGILMGLAHRDLPYWGVQFHPESVLTGAGPQLIANFLRLTSGAPAADAREVRA